MGRHGIGGSRAGWGCGRGAAGTILANKLINVHNVSG